ncbi:GBLP protein, partial [Pseudoatta argentina]
MEDRNSKEVSNIIIDSPVQNSVSEIYFNKTPTPSIASIVTNERCTPLSVSMQTISDIEHRYQLVGNIEIINQMEVNQDVLCICYTENYDFLAAGLSDGNVKFYKVNSGEDTLILCDAEMMLNPSPVTAVKHRPVSRTHPITHTVIATYANGCVKCWHYPTAQCLYTIRERRQTLGLAYHPQLPKFVTVGDDAILYLYDEETKTLERVFRGSDTPDVMDGHKSRVFSACFNPKSAYELISGGWDDTIQFWDTRQAHSFRFISGVHICGDGLDINKNGKEEKDVNISDSQYRHLSCSDGSLSRTYTPKVHKQNCQFRIIVSSIGSPLYALASFLHNTMFKTIPKAESYIKNSFQLVDGLDDNYKLIALDVVSLFTNIPTDIVLDCINDNWNFISKKCKLSKKEFLNFGTPIGSPLSSIIVDLVMQRLEKIALSMFKNHVLFYFRYVVDLCAAVTFLECFNSFHPLKLTLEIRDNSLNFLNIIFELLTGIINLVSRGDFKISSLTIHYLRKRVKKSINLMDRAILPDSEFYMKNLTLIINILLNNDYPLKLIFDTINKRLKNIRRIAEHRNYIRWNTSSHSVITEHSLDSEHDFDWNNIEILDEGPCYSKRLISEIILTCAWQKNNPLQLWDYGSGKLITTIEPDSYSSLLYVGKYVTNMYIACGGCDVNLFRIVDLRSHSTIAMIRNLRSGVYSLDVGPLKSKYSKRILPKFAFCAGTTIFEVNAQPE